MKRGFYWKLAFQNLKNNRRIYVPFLLSATGIIMMFYIIQSLGSSIDGAGLYGGYTVITMMNLGAIVIGVFAVLFLFYTNSFIMKRRKKELGLYNILGMEKFHIGKIIFRETLLTAFASMALGIGFGILFSRAVFLLLQKLLGVDLHIAFSVPPMALLVTLLLFLAIFFVTMLYNILQVRLAKPIELLHGSDVGEKEPKAHWLLAVLGMLSLGAGYYLAVTIQDPVEALAFFFIAVILVIFGTYLLFITGITALLKLLKKKKSFYYKSNHFTTVSGMLYRMKQNAAGLASICILFTCLLVTVSTTFALYTSMEDMIHVRFPREIMLIAEGANESAKEAMRDMAREECEKAGFTPKNIQDEEHWSFYMGRTGTVFENSDLSQSEHYAVVRVYPIKEYERLSGEAVTLDENDLLLYDPGNDFPREDVLTIGESTFSLHRTDFDLSQAGDNVMISNVECFALVAPEGSDIVELLAQESPGGALSAYSPSFNYYFDIGGTREDIRSLANALEQRIAHDPLPDVSYESLRIENIADNYEDFAALYGGLFFLGIFLGLLFLMGTVMIIYYKQVSEGYEDAKRFSIMQKVGMSRKEVKKSIHSQILLVFFLPLLTAVMHLCFAFPMLQKILMMMNMMNFWVILGSTVGCIVVFGAIYAIVYAITARTYYKIVETAAD